MILPGDFEKLQERSEAEHLLKPWFDMLIDISVVVLVLIAVVTGVVALYAPGPICIPQNSSQTTGHESIPEFTNRNLYDFINSICRKDIPFLVQYFPNGLFFLAGAFLVCGNLWFRLKSAVLKQYHDLLQESNKYTACPEACPEACTEALPVDGQLVRTTMYRDRPQNSQSTLRPATAEYMTSKQACTALKVDEELLKLQWNRQSRKVKEYNALICGTCCKSRCGFNICSLKCSYICTVGLQLLIGLSFMYLLYEAIKTITDGAMFTCKVQEGLPYKNFRCSYSIARFYLHSGITYWIASVLHFFFSIIKLVWAIMTYRKAKKQKQQSADVNFLDTLVKTSSPSYADKCWECHHEQHSNSPREEKRAKLASRVINGSQV